MNREIVLSLPVFDFINYFAAARKAIKEERNHQLRVSAHVGWQTYTLLTAALSSKKDPIKAMDYGEYMGSLGLLTEAEQEQIKAMKQIRAAQIKEENKRKAAEGLEKAAKILSMDRARRKKGG